MSVHAEPSLIHTLPDACGLGSLWDKVRTLPVRCAHSLDGQVAGWRGDWSCCCKGVPRSAPEGLSLFGKILLLNPVAPSLQGRACPLTQPTSPARPGTVWVRVAHGPTLNSPQRVPTVSSHSQTVNLLLRLSCLHSPRGFLSEAQEITIKFQASGRVREAF